MNDFEKYYREDTQSITLQGVTFHVKLPGRDNKKFQRAVMSASMEIEDGEYKVKSLTPVEMVETQIEAFVRTCIRSVDNWDDFTADKLLAMPDACEDLWTVVTDLTVETEAEAEEAVKKLQTLYDGATSGQENSTGTETLKVAEG